MKKFLLLFILFFSTMPIYAQISDSEIRKHIERIGLDVISMGSKIQVKQKMCYQKRAVEIYDLIKLLIYITAVFFILVMAFRLFMGEETKPIKTVLFIGLALGLIEIFPNMLFVFSGTDFRDSKCPVIELDRDILSREFQTNEKLKSAIKQRKKIEEFEKQKPTVESIWQRNKSN